MNLPFTTYVKSSKDINFVKRIDAKYYNPKFIQLREDLKLLKSQPLKKYSSIKITKGETPIWRGDSYISDGIPFVRSEQLKKFFLDLSINPVDIGDSVHHRMKRSKIYTGDILMAIVGKTSGSGALITDENFEGNCNQAVSIIRPKNINPYYLMAVLNSNIVRDQVIQVSSGNTTKINLDLSEARELLIPNLPIQKQVEEMVLKAFKLNRKSEEAYIQAEQLLYDSLGLQKEDIKGSVTYIESNKNIDIVKRIDPKFYHPRNEWFSEYLKDQGFETATLKQLAPRVKSAFKDENFLDKHFKYIEIGDVNNHLGYIEDFTYDLVSKLPVNKKIQVHAYDLVYSKVRPYRKGISVILPELDGSVVTSGFSVLRPNNRVPVFYLLCYLRSNIGQISVIKHMAGATYPTVDDNVIESIEVPILDEITTKRISLKMKHAVFYKYLCDKWLKKAMSCIEQTVATLVKKNREI